jgi:hypothetical protein
MKNVAIVFASLVAAALLLSPLAHTSPDDLVTVWWAKTHLVNKERLATIPQWAIVQDGKSKHVNWTNHVSNPRFALYEPWETPGDPSDDLVLDKATGLVWTRNTSLGGSTMTWNEAADYCRGLAMGNVMGWRLASIEEMYTLFEPSGFVTGTENLWVNAPSVDGWWTGTITHSDPEPPNVVVDEDEANVDGSAFTYGMAPCWKCYNSDHAVAPGSADPTSFVQWAMAEPQLSPPLCLTPPCNYKVYAWWGDLGQEGATNAKYTIEYQGGFESITVNQQVSSNMWHLLGEYPGTDGISVFLTDEADGQVSADAVRFNCENCIDSPIAMFKGPAADTDCSWASTDDMKHVWAVRGGVNMLSPQPEPPD